MAARLQGARWRAAVRLGPVLGAVALAVAVAGGGGAAVGVAWAEPAPSLAPLAAEQQALLAGIATDPPPPKLLNGQHYVVSDEDRPERFRETMADRGALLVGVGTDQNYFFAGWARPELVVVIDFDQTVVDLHLAYRAFFEAADDADGFLELWSDQGHPSAAAALDRLVPAPERRRAVDRALSIGRHLVHGRLVNLRARFQAQGVASFLTDPAQYRSVAALVRAGRVVALRGDLTGSQSVQGVARAARELGLVVKVLYLSNVEQYVRYSPQFRANIQSLPVDGQSLVLRTYHQGPGRGYVYAVQSAEHFRAWLARDDVKTLGDVMFRGRAELGAGLIRLGPPPS